MKNVFIIFLGIVLTLSVGFIGPFLFLWSINTLFNLGIDYTAENIVASAILLIIFSLNSGYIKKS